MKTNRISISHLIYLLLLGFFIHYCSVYIKISTIEHNEKTYYILLDDAMISMRYAKNFANGDGLVWNPGEDPVEGYTNPLWVFYMSIFHFSDIPENLTSAYIQYTGLILLLINLYFIKKITDYFSTHWLVSYIAVGLTALYYPLVTWSLLGMEVSLLALLTSLIAWLVIKSIHTNTPSLQAFIFLCIGLITRIDFVIPAGVVILYIFFFAPKSFRPTLYKGIAIFILTGILLTIFRYSYYGEWLPNTYYLKVYGMDLFVRIRQGILTMLDFLWLTGPSLYLLAFLALFTKQDKKLYLLYGLFIAQFAYSVYTGGDFLDRKISANRFITQGMPLFFVLFSLSLEEIKYATLNLINNKSKLIQYSSNTFLVFISITSFLTFNRQPLDPTRYINFQRLQLEIIPNPIPGTHRQFEIAVTLEEITKPEATIAIVGAGTTTYFTDRTYFDILGKNDKFIARTPPVSSGGAYFQPGHNKWDYDYSLRQLQPDVVAQWRDETDPEPYLDGYIKVVINDIPHYLKIDSPNINWDKVPPPQSTE